MRALDLFCGAGGASEGLHRAGYEVVGVDLAPQPSYPFEFHRADAMEFTLEGFDFVWASPPCQRYIRGGNTSNPDAPDLVGPVRDRLAQVGCPTVIENVPGAPLRSDIVLCGSMFGLGVRRHRWFEVSWAPPMTAPCDHSRPIVGVYGHPHGSAGAWPSMLPSTIETWREAMGIDWMSAAEISQAIPPAYAEFIGHSAQLQVGAA